MTSTLRTTTQIEPAPESGEIQRSVQLTLEVGPMAHGGHCVARHEGRVIFVRHAIPGEIVVAELTESDPSAQLWWADAISVVQPSEFRRAHPWKLADPKRSYPAGRRPVSGAEYGHIVLEHQRRLKAQVFRDTLARLGNQRSQDVEVQVHGLEEDFSGGLGWRTRNTFAVSSTGRLRMFVHRSQATVPVSNLPMATPEVNALQLWGINFSGASRLELITPGHGREVLIIIVPLPEVSETESTLLEHTQRWQEQLTKLPGHVSAMVLIPSKKRKRLAAITQLSGRPWVEEEVVSKRFGTKTFRVSGRGIWPEHCDAPAPLTEAAMTAIDAKPGQVVANLYAGVGMLSAYLADAVGPEGMVMSVDPVAQASKDARHNLQGVPQAVVLKRSITRALSSWLESPKAALTKDGLAGRRLDTVVLTPPPSGAGRNVINRIHQLNPDRIVYVSCDPASLARDIRRLDTYGWQLTSVNVFDLHPNTHRIESISVFTRP